MQARSLESASTNVGYPASAFNEFCSRTGCRLLPIIGAEG